MHTEHKREDPLVDLGYETRDINYKALGKVAVVFFFFAFLSFFVVGVWFWLAQPKLSSELDPRKPMPEIKLQSNIAVRADIQVMRQNETKVLSSTGPNPDGKSQHIPIDQAMNLISKRGLPHELSNVVAISHPSVSHVGHPDAVLGVTTPPATFVLPNTHNNHHSHSGGFEPITGQTGTSGGQMGTSGQ